MRRRRMGRHSTVQSRGQRHSAPMRGSVVSCRTRVTAALRAVGNAVAPLASQRLSTPAAQRAPSPHLRSLAVGGARPAQPATLKHCPRGLACSAVTLTSAPEQPMTLSRSNCKPQSQRSCNGGQASISRREHVTCRAFALGSARQRQQRFLICARAVSATA